MRPVLISIFLTATAVLAQNCGPKYKNKVCAAGSCCSQYGWVSAYDHMSFFSLDSH